MTLTANNVAKTQVTENIIANSRCMVGLLVAVCIPVRKLVIQQAVGFICIVLTGAILRSFGHHDESLDLGMHFSNQMEHLAQPQ
jgi:hypothetical protein